MQGHQCDKRGHQCDGSCCAFNKMARMAGGCMAVVMLGTVAAAGLYGLAKLMLGW